MSGRGIKIAIQITKAIIPIVLEALEKVEQAKSPQSQGGTKITKEERRKIAIDISLSAVPELHDALLKVITKEI